MESTSQNDPRHHHMGFLHSRFQMRRLHNCIVLSWGCLEHQAGERSWEEMVKHQAWSWGEGEQALKE